HRSQVTGFVLGKPPASERVLLDECIDEASRAVDILIDEGWGPALQQLHSFRASK
ncbi:MAG: aminoacyl-tRNA hydrolase, partial [Pseudomonadota bacterium]|nr:aminoacyl-tRNA hydrolase [Pseudomonadota bacterium]